MDTIQNIIKITVLNIIATSKLIIHSKIYEWLSNKFIKFIYIWWEYRIEKSTIYK